MKKIKDILMVGGMPIPTILTFPFEYSHGMSLGIVFLGTYLEKFNYSVDVFDPLIFYSKMFKNGIKNLGKKLTIEKRTNYTSKIVDLTYDKFKRILNKTTYDVIGVSTSSIINLDLKNIYIAREMQPNSLIIAGGPGLSLKAEDFLEASEADIAVIAEGEIICKELMDRIKKNELKHPMTKEQFDKHLSDIPFILCKVKDGNKTLVCRSISDNNTYVEKYLPDVDKLPLLDFRLMNAHIKKNVQFMYTNRSCPGTCTFCSMASLKKKISNEGGFGMDKLMKRWMSPEKVIDWIIGLYNNCSNLHIISFNEDTFTYPMDRAKKICELIIKNKKSGKIGKDITFICQTRSNLVNEELLELMEKAGFVMISYGAESGSNGMLRCIRKGFTAEDTIRAVDMTLKTSILPQINLILILPKTKIEDCIKTAELGLYCYENGASTQVNDCILAYYGTDIEMEYRNSDNITYDEFVKPSSVACDNKKKKQLLLEGRILPERSEMVRLYNIFMNKEKTVVNKFYNDTEQWFGGTELLSLSSIGTLIYSLDKLTHEKKNLKKYMNKIEILKSRYNNIIEQQIDVNKHFWYFGLDGKIVGLDEK